MVRSLRERAEVRDRESQGKRSLLSLAVTLSICSVLVVSPVVAHAEDESEEVPEPSDEHVEEVVEEVEKTSVGISDIDGKLDVITQVISDNTVALYRVIDEIQKDRQIEEEKQKAEEKEREEDKDEKSPELIELEGINSRLDTLLKADDVPEEAVQKSLAKAANVAYVTYGNVSPTNQYATYAKQLIPKMGWNDDYVFLQDTQTSYVILWGDLSMVDNNTISGTDVNYCRWYNAGNLQGYLLDQGTVDATVTLQSYTVLSTLGSYPVLDDSTTLLRNEVGFYACVAAVFALLHSIFGFVLRNRNGTTD